MIRKILALNIVYFLFTFSFCFAFSDKELSYLEYSKYGRIYAHESLAERLSRLETDMLGMRQKGDIDSRLYTLSRIANDVSSLSGYSPYENYYSGKKENSIRRFWNNITSAFGDYGVITGFTPVLTNSDYEYSSDISDNYPYGFSNNQPQSYPYYNRPYNNWNHNNYHRPYTNHYSCQYDNRNRIGRNTYYNGYNPYDRYVPSNVKANTIAKSSVHILQD